MNSERGSQALNVDAEECLASDYARLGAKRDWGFWLVWISNLMCDILSVLDRTAVATTLPTIVRDLHGNEFVWVGSAYLIASTSVLPIVGGIVSVYGRKPVLLSFILVFAIGSAISGAAQNMSMLIAGRAVQGFGGGGCLSVTEIIYADMVPLPERGKFQGVNAAVWAIAGAAGPAVGGALASAGAWRWLFFLNLPLCGIAILLEFVFLRVRTPRMTWKEKSRQMDWIGVFIIIGSTVASLLGLTWGGIQFPWASAHVLVPLVIGCTGILVYLAIEAFWVREPSMPRFIFNDRTVLSGYLGTFFHGIVSIAAMFYLPVYFQASKGASAIGSGVDLIPLALIVAVFVILCGVSVKAANRYRPQNYIGWALTMIGFGILTPLHADSSRAQYIGSEVLLAVGLGIVWISTQFPILAPLPFSNNARALGFFTFTRVFAQSWGITIGGTILQNSLQRTLPAEFLATLPQGVQLTYSVIPTIPRLAEPLQTQVRAAFAESTKLMWQVMLGLSGAGLLTCLLMSEIPMKTQLDDTWALQETDCSPKVVSEDGKAE